MFKLKWVFNKQTNAPEVASSFMTLLYEIQPCTDW